MRGIHSLPVTLEMRQTANRETFECFLAVDGEPVYGDAGVGAFLTNPTPPQALAAAIRLAGAILVRPRSLVRPPSDA